MRVEFCTESGSETKPTNLAGGGGGVGGGAGK